MGQGFYFVNIDQRSYAYVGKIGESWHEEFWLNHLVNRFWAEDRIVVVGEGAHNFPPSSLNRDELDLCPPTKCPSQWIDDDFKELEYAEWRHPLRYVGNKALVNLSQQEYIRGDLFSGIHTERGPKLWHFGLWAGSRLALENASDYVNDPEFKDITEVVFYEVYTVWEADRVGWSNRGPSRCHCQLCEKFREMRRRNFDPLREPAPPSSLSPLPSIQIDGVLEPPTANGVVLSGKAISGNTPVSSHQEPRSIKQLWFIPMDVQYCIFAELDRFSLASCALVCHAFAREATRALYRRVELWVSTYTKEFCHTLKSDPMKKFYIRRLSLQIQISATYCQHAHNILKELPNLEYLEFYPCWVSYGERKNFNDYPFKLRSLRWGLIPDIAMLLFMRSQPSIEELEFYPGQEPPSDWFKFWPDLLPNLRLARASSNMLNLIRGLKAGANVTENGQCTLRKQRKTINPMWYMYPWTAEDEVDD
ncbi:hypothetical protein FRC17_002877 [Serendipita sp. 399]|nr:hypothetical protein FRC17_002877 [Serendipita sp. 399]